ncbi:MAG: alpha/beta hydrolase [Pseudomonadota bacterium]|nr:alpha/beta hydrolase [Pseudomonadota bacterium]
MKPDKINIAYEIHGDLNNPIIVIVQGLGMPLTATPPQLVSQLKESGYCLLLLDNRDIGQSDKIKQKPPNIIFQALKYKLGLRVKYFYKLDDMMNDINNLLVKLNIETAHIIGVSMGGMIAQLMAINHPGKIKSLISIMSTSGDPNLPGPSWKIAKFILNGAKNKNINGAESFYKHLWRLIGSPQYPMSDDDIDSFVKRIVDRGMTTGGSVRQILAILKSYNRVPQLKKLTLPTLVIHGVEDKLVPVECGVDTANAIDKSELWCIPGMGHDFPLELIDEFVSRISNHINKAEKAS